MSSSSILRDLSFLLILLPVLLLFVVMIGTDNEVIGVETVQENFTVLSVSHQPGSTIYGFVGSAPVMINSPETWSVTVSSGKHRTVLSGKENYELLKDRKGFTATVVTKRVRSNFMGRISESSHWEITNIKV